MNLEVRYIPVDSITPYEKNSRTHSKAQVDQICDSINEFGFTNPILLDETNTIIAGHGRLEAAKKLGHYEVPTILLSGLTDEQKRAYVIADNKLALNAGWDMDALKDEMSILDESGFDLTILGFDHQELASMFDESEELDLKEQSYSEVFNVIVECADEEEQEKVFNRLDQEGYKCRVQSL